MVQAIIDIDDKTNRVLNIVKAQFDLKDKSQAIQVIANRYEQEILEPTLRSEYLEKLSKVEKQKGIKFKNVGELRKIIEDR
ncbi:TPA: DUF2683 family protein [Candidatus Woesearchaeota archaeon]|nr:DUF2683 family protein [Candidatus Woesearchaeota archaeon]HIH32034.1 DUF2683 family protein [Candidatus Woesearchaeota archaeon]HIH54977.1 DUF2683 family protein [Candidatus Woesearchaeota archaeon]HIJ01633.1 DUF2683 family protein [Candidatus Woesearchaeota archaeon]HIJ13373.1 DUF2683 family protein [Candidatus Woesearchaeota archaeon]